MDFRPGQLRAVAAAALGPRIEAAGAYLAAKMKEVTGIQGAPGARRSLPGEAPRMETTVLNESITSIYNADTLEASAGTDVGYGRALEVEMNRPWCLATLKNEHEELRRILGAR